MTRQYHHVRAIILKKRPWREADYRVTLYTETNGKIEAIAKGARNITSSFSGHLETLNIGFFQIYESPQRLTILQCQTEKNFKNIRKNLQSSLLSLTFVEILEKSTSKDEGKTIFNLIEKTLEELDKSEASLLIMESFKLKLMALLGVLPEVTRCSLCHTQWQRETTVWLHKEGYMSCQNCKQELRGETFAIEFKFIKLLHFLLHQDIGKKRLILSPIEQNQLTNISHLFLSNYLNQEIIGEKLLNFAT